jgi:hypothetical protein
MKYLTLFENFKTNNMGTFYCFYIDLNGKPKTVGKFNNLPDALDRMVNFINSFNIDETVLYVATSTDLKNLDTYWQTRLSNRFTTYVNKYENGVETFVYDDGEPNPDRDRNSRD